MPEQEAVLAITAGIDNMQSVLDQVWDTLLRALGPAPLPEAQTAQQELVGKLGSLAFPLPEGQPGSPMQEAVSGQRYAIEANPAGIESVSFEFSEESCLLKLKDAAGEEQIACGRRAWKAGTSYLFDRRPKKQVACGAWTARDTFAITLRYYETPFCFTLTAQFQDGRLRTEGKMNVSFGDLNFPPLMGQMI